MAQFFFAMGIDVLTDTKTRYKNSYFRRSMNFQFWGGRCGRGTAQERPERAAGQRLPFWFARVVFADSGVMIVIYKLQVQFLQKSEPLVQTGVATIPSTLSLWWKFKPKHARQGIINNSYDPILGIHGGPNDKGARFGPGSTKIEGGEHIWVIYPTILPWWSSTETPD